MTTATQITASTGSESCNTMDEGRLSRPLEAGQAEIDEAKALKFKTPYLQKRLDEDGGKGFDPLDAFHMHVLANELPRARQYNRLMVKHSGDFSGIEFSNPKRTGQFAFVLPDASDVGQWRVSYFDTNGFFSHHSEPTLEKAQLSLVSDGYTVESKGMLDKLAATKEWERGMIYSALIQRLNSRQIKHAEFVKLVSELDA